VGSKPSNYEKRKDRAEKKGGSRFLWEKKIAASIAFVGKGRLTEKGKGGEQGPRFRGDKLLKRLWAGTNHVSEGGKGEE